MIESEKGHCKACLSNSLNSNLMQLKRASALKEVKRLYKEFGFTAGMLKGALAKGRGEKWKISQSRFTEHLG